MIMKLVAFAFLFTFTVNGQESSQAAATQSIADSQPTAVQSDNAQHSLLAMMLIGFLTPTDARQAQQDNEAGSYVHKVDGDETSLAPSITPMTSITIDTPQSQSSEAEKETVRL